MCSSDLARVAVTQEFHNPSAEWLEGVYVFPLPEGSAVDAMRLEVGTRVLEGQIREREEARQTYRQGPPKGEKGEGERGGWGKRGEIGGGRVI